MNDRSVEESILKRYGAGESLASRIIALHRYQIETWTLLRENTSASKNGLIKTFVINNFTYTVLLSPHRVKSTAADLSREYIENRKSFLLPENLPPEQKALKYEEEYLILTNPYPIFPMHFTIPTIEQKPQEIKGRFAVALKLAKEFAPEFVVLYNGAECGASAPDHFHFQIGNAGFLPIETEYPRAIRQYSQIVSHDSNSAVYAIDDSVRKYFIIESDLFKQTEFEFYRLLSAFQDAENIEKEPMMNLLVKYSGNNWTTIVFPRSKHRPDIFFGAEKGKMLVSPAIVDLCGITVLPRESDFRRMNEKLLSKILREIMIDNEIFVNIIANL